MSSVRRDFKLKLVNHGCYCQFNNEIELLVNAKEFSYQPAIGMQPVICLILTVSKMEPAEIPI